MIVFILSNFYRSFWIIIFVWAIFKGFKIYQINEKFYGSSNKEEYEIFVKMYFLLLMCLIEDGFIFKNSKNH
jgi:hypothetical protein